LTNTGDASAADIAALARKAQEKVLEVFGVKLEPEVNLIGLTLN
jgi:UDP-N-acetylmuramate dehydrogenase